MNSYVFAIVCVIAVSVLCLFRRTHYKVVQLITSVPDLKEEAEKINAENISVPRNQNKIAPPKPLYERKQYTYPYDSHDTFYYDVLKTDKARKDTAFVLVCFMGGHSKSACIRRAAQRFSDDGYPVYILIPRGMQGLRLDPAQKKFRSEGYDTEDLNTLVNELIPENNVIISGYSLGGFTLGHYLTSKNSDISKVRKAIFCFVEHDPSNTVRMPLRARKMLATQSIKYVRENVPYFLAHGVTQEELDEIFKVGTVDHYDQLIWCKRHNLASVYDYYDMVSLVKRIPQLSVPSLFFNVADDQIAGKYLPLAEFRSN